MGVGKKDNKRTNSLSIGGVLTHTAAVSRRRRKVSRQQYRNGVNTSVKLTKGAANSSRARPFRSLCMLGARAYRPRSPDCGALRGKACNFGPGCAKGVFPTGGRGLVTRLRVPQALRVSPALRRRKPSSGRFDVLTTSGRSWQIPAAAPAALSRGEVCGYLNVRN